MQNDLEKCIIELNKPLKERNNEIIMDYLRTLNSLMSSMIEKYENNEEILSKMLPMMIFEKFKKNDLITENGAKWNDIYIILNGNVSVLTTKNHGYFMSEDEFVLHLLKLRKYNQIELIIHCIKLNAHLFSFTQKILVDFMLNLGNKKIKLDIILKNENLIKEAIKVIKYLRSKENNNNGIENISIKKYISLSEVDDNIINNQEEINNSDKSIEEDIKLVKIPIYEQTYLLKPGDLLFDYGHDYINPKINETLIANTDCLVFKINKDNYREITKEYLAKAKNKLFNLLLTYKIFDNMPYEHFDKKYFHYFKYLKVYSKQPLLKEGDICDNVYFISKGEYELYLYQNIEQINNIILQHKNLLDELKLNIIKERIKENEIYPKYKNKLHQFFKQFDKINLEKVAYNIRNNEINTQKEGNSSKNNSNKKKLKIGILKTRQIIGLSDIINRNIGNNCLFNCVCSSFEGELYYIPYNKFLLMYENEFKVKLFTYELLYQNIYYLIQRLLFHKQIINEKASKKVNEEEKIFIQSMGIDKKPKNKIIDKIKINSKNIAKDIRYNNKTFTKRNYNENSLKNYETKTNNIFPYKKINIIGNKKTLNTEEIRHNLSEKKCSGSEINDESYKNKDSLKKSFFSKSIKTNKKFNILDKNLKKFSQTVLIDKKEKLYEMKILNNNTNSYLPILVINNNEVRVLLH